MREWLNLVIQKSLRHAVEGHFIRRIREEIDRWIGCFARALMRNTVTVQENKVLFHTQ